MNEGAGLALAPHPNPLPALRGEGASQVTLA